MKRGNERYSAPAKKSQEEINAYRQLKRKRKQRQVLFGIILFPAFFLIIGLGFLLAGMSEANLEDAVTVEGTYASIQRERFYGVRHSSTHYIIRLNASSEAYRIDSMAQRRFDYASFFDSTTPGAQITLLVSNKKLLFGDVLVYAIETGGTVYLSVEDTEKAYAVNRKLGLLTGIPVTGIGFLLALALFFLFHPLKGKAVSSTARR